MFSNNFSVKYISISSILITFSLFDIKLHGDILLSLPLNILLEIVLLLLLLLFSILYFFLATSSSTRDVFLSKLTASGRRSNTDNSLM